MRGPSRYQALHFIPESAQTDDPTWAGRFNELANAMVLYGAKSRLIQRFTGLKHKDVVLRCQVLRGCEPSAGRLRSIKPARFVTRFDRSTNDFLLQCAAFAQCLTRIEDAFNEPLNRGWLLVMAYRTYDRLSERLVAAMSMQKLDINVCWELMVHFGNARFRHLADIGQKSCSHCGTNFLALNAAEEASDFCPMCGIQQYYHRLTQVGSQRHSTPICDVAQAG